MAAKKSAQYPYRWDDGTWHSITQAQHTANEQHQQGTVSVGGQIVTPQNRDALGTQWVTDTYNQAGLTGVDPLTGSTRVVPDARIEPWYQNQLAGLGQTRNDNFDAIKTGVGRSSLDTGFKFGDTLNNVAAIPGGPGGYSYDTYSFDPNGYKSNGVVDIDKATYDPKNPFTKMGILQQAYEGQKRGTTNSMASRGQLYSGAIGNQRNIDHRNASGAFNTLVQSFQDLIGNANTGVGSAIGNYNTGAGTAAGQRLNMQIGGYSG